MTASLSLLNSGSANADPDDALCKYATLFGLENPARHDVQLLRSWFERPKMGSFPLLGIDANSWNEEHEHDLVSLWSRRPPDAFSRWLSGSVVPTFHRIVGARYKQPLSDNLGSALFEYSDKTIRQVTRFASTLIASALPLLSVAILYTVKSNILRMGIITVLSSLFSIALSLMTSAHGIEVFAATSAYGKTYGT